MVLSLHMMIGDSKTVTSVMAVACNLNFQHFLLCLKPRDGFVNGGVLGAEVRVARSGAAVENWVLESCARSGDRRKTTLRSRVEHQPLLPQS